MLWVACYALFSDDVRRRRGGYVSEAYVVNHCGVPTMWLVVRNTFFVPFIC
jgi:hypothetical protein